MFFFVLCYASFSCCLRARLLYDLDTKFGFQLELLLLSRSNCLPALFLPSTLHAVQCVDVCLCVCVSVCANVCESGRIRCGILEDFHESQFLLTNYKSPTILLQHTPPLFDAQHPSRKTVRISTKSDLRTRKHTHTHTHTHTHPHTLTNPYIYMYIDLCDSLRYREISFLHLASRVC